MVHPPCMRRHSSLPEPFDAGPFRVADATRAGVGKGRLRGGDLESPFRRVRSRAITDVRDLAAAYAMVMSAHHCFAGVTAARLWGLPIAAAWSRDEPLVIARPNRSAPGSAKGTRHIAYASHRLTHTVAGGLRLLEPLPTALTLARELPHEALVQVVDALLTPSRRYPGLRLPEGRIRLARHPRSLRRSSDGAPASREWARCARPQRMPVWASTRGSRPSHAC
jgi:hypothetical protein